MHVADPLAIRRALLADFSALATEMRGVFRSHEQEMHARAADLRASEQETEVLGLDVLATGFEAVSHRGAEAGAITGKASVDAGLHPSGCPMHESFSWVGEGAERQ